MRRQDYYQGRPDVRLANSCIYNYDEVSELNEVLRILAIPLTRLTFNFLATLITKTPAYVTIHLGARTESPCIHVIVAMKALGILARAPQLHRYPFLRHKIIT